MLRDGPFSTAAATNPPISVTNANEPENGHLQSDRQKLHDGGRSDLRRTSVVCPFLQRILKAAARVK